MDGNERTWKTENTYGFFKRSAVATTITFIVTSAGTKSMWRYLGPCKTRIIPRKSYFLLKRFFDFEYDFFQL